MGKDIITVIRDPFHILGTRFSFDANDHVVKQAALSSSVRPT